MHSSAIRVSPRAVVVALLLALATLFGAAAMSTSHTQPKPHAFVDCNALRCGDG